jgi:predicted nicotinamide N-methyase
LAFCSSGLRGGLDSGFRGRLLQPDHPAWNVSRVSASPLTVPEARSNPVLRRFPLRRLRLPLGSGTMDLVVPDAQGWIRQGEWTGATLRGAEPPYWIQIWPAAVAVARLLTRIGSLVGKRTLDLGCGLGVPGIAAGRAGASVTFADRQPEALAFAGWNAARQPAAPAPSLHQVDWSREVVPGTFDLLLLSDVSYRPLHHPALKRHIAAVLDADGVVLHADPLRRESTPFVNWLGAEFATVCTQRRTHFLERTLDVRLVVATRSPQALGTWQQAMSSPAARTDPDASSSERINS